MNHDLIDDDLEIGQNPIGDHLMKIAPVFKGNTDKSAYKRDKVCTICGSPFSLLGSNQKHTCGFCYRGLCSRCSSQQIYEPVKHEIIKICDNCYSEYIKTQITSKIQFEIMDEQAQIRFIQNKLDLERVLFLKEHETSHELKSKIIIEEGKANSNAKNDYKRKDKVMAAISQLDDVIIKLESKVVENSLFLKGKILKISQYNNEISDSKSQNQTEIYETQELMERIHACQEDNENLKEKIRKIELDKVTDEQTISSNEVELSIKIDRLKAEIENIGKNCKKMEKRISELRNEGGVKIAAVNQLSQSILISKDGINPSIFCAQLDNPYKSAKEQYKFNQQEIDELKYELEDLRDTDKEEFNAQEFSLPPEHIENKKCIII